MIRGRHRDRDVAPARGKGGSSNQLVFTAGLNGEKDGLLGTLTTS